MVIRQNAKKIGGHHINFLEMWFYLGQDDGLNTLFLIYKYNDFFHFYLPKRQNQNNLTSCINHIKLMIIGEITMF